MSHTHALKRSAVPAAGACRPTSARPHSSTTGIVVANTAESQTRVVSTATRWENTTSLLRVSHHRNVAQSSLSDGDGSAAVDAAMEGIKTMLIDLDDCLYDIEVQSALSMWDRLNSTEKFKAPAAVISRSFPWHGPSCTA